MAGGTTPITTRDPNDRRDRNENRGPKVTNGANSGRGGRSAAPRASKRRGRRDEDIGGVDDLGNESADNRSTLSVGRGRPSSSLERVNIGEELSVRKPANIAVKSNRAG